MACRIEEIAEISRIRIERIKHRVLARLVIREAHFRCGRKFVVHFEHLRHARGIWIQYALHTGGILVDLWIPASDINHIVQHFVSTRYLEVIQRCKLGLGKVIGIQVEICEINFRSLV